MKKILMVTGYFETHVGGVEIAAGQLARALHRFHGLEVTWAASDASPVPEDFPGRCAALPAANFTERRLDVPLPLPSPRAIARLRRLVTEADAVLLHDTLYPLNVAAYRLARRRGVPVVIVQHIGFVPYRNPILRTAVRAANAAIARPMLAGADATVFISGLTQRHFVGRCRFRQAPELIFNGLAPAFETARDVPDRRELRRRLKLNPDRLTALFVGRFVEKKGLDILRRLAGLNPETDFCLVGWGRIAPEGWGLANVHAARGVRGADLIPYYQSADIFLLPSVGEGFPLVVQEALACGTPVLGSEEILTADPWLEGRVRTAPVHAEQPERTAALWHEALRRFMEERASAPKPDRREAVQRYSWRTAAGRYAEVLEAVSRPHAVSRTQPAPTQARADGADQLTE